MKSTKVIWAALLAVSITGAQSADALILGGQITIHDGASSGSGWNGPKEDQEVESGNATGQAWDMEGFFLEGTTLSMVGGRDLPNLPRRDMRERVLGFERLWVGYNERILTNPEETRTLFAGIRRYHRLMRVLRLEDEDLDRGSSRRIVGRRGLPCTSTLLVR